MYCSVRIVTLSLLRQHIYRQDFAYTQWKRARWINRAPKLFIQSCLCCKHCWLCCSPCNSITEAYRRTKVVTCIVRCTSFVSRDACTFVVSVLCWCMSIFVCMFATVCSQCVCSLARSLVCLFACICCVCALCGSFSRCWLNSSVFQSWRCRCRCCRLRYSLCASMCFVCMWIVFSSCGTTRWHTTQAVKLWLLCHTFVLFPIRFLKLHRRIFFISIRNRRNGAVRLRLSLNLIHKREEKKRLSFVWLRGNENIFEWKYAKIYSKHNNGILFTLNTKRQIVTLNWFVHWDQHFLEAYISYMMKNRSYRLHTCCIVYQNQIVWKKWICDVDQLTTVHTETIVINWFMWSIFEFVNEQSKWSVCIRFWNISH